MPAKSKAKAAAPRFTPPINRRYRLAEVEDSADAAEMTLPVAFSSEYPVERIASKWDVEQGVVSRTGEKYLEVLSHDAGDADLSPLNNDGAFLDEHRNDSQLGKVNHAEISADRKGRAVLEFDGETDLSKTRYRQMKKRSRPHISFGYTRTKFLGDVDLGDGKTGKRFAWSADEISSVAVPADPTVGSKRSADMAHCTKCGDEYPIDDLDDDYRCERCGPVARAKAKDFVFRIPCSEDVRAKGGKDIEVSFGNLCAQVSAALREHDEFLPWNWPYVQDIVLEGTEFTAIVNEGGKYYAIGFELGVGQVILDEEAEEVNCKTEWEPIGEDDDRSKPRHSPLATRSRPPVDSQEFSNVETIAKNLTPENKMKLRTLLLDPAPAAGGGGAAVADESAVRAKLTPQIRGEVEQEFRKKGEARAGLKKEIRALGDEFVKSHGKNWAGDPGKVVVVGERIRAFEQEAYDAPETHSDSEIRSDFKQKCNDLIRGSRPPREQVEAATLDDSLASRCSLRALYNAAAKSQASGERHSAWTPKDGAEREADQEIRHRAQEFPGGAGIEIAGVCLPFNMPLTRAAIRASGARMTRDSLAGDFPTAGALIAPEFKFPTIELLRNKMALGRAGITILGGVIGNLVLPRQTGATTSQSLAEGAILAAYDQTFDQIRMTPHRIGSKQQYSRLALLQTTEDFEALVMNDHMAQNALRADYLVLNGAGANDEPLGLMNQVGIGVVTFGGSASAAYKNCVALETAIRKANIDEEPSFITTSTGRGTLRITPATLTGSTVVSGESNAIWVGEEIIGRPAVDSQQVPGDALIALVGRHVVMAQWGGWQVVLDTITLADQDKIKLSMNTYIDAALRHPQAVARSADSIATLS